MTKEEIKLNQDRDLLIRKLISICGNNQVGFNQLIACVGQICLKKQLQFEDILQLSVIIKGL